MPSVMPHDFTVDSPDGTLLYVTPATGAAGEGLKFSVSLGHTLETLFQNRGEGRYSLA